MSEKIDDIKNYSDENLVSFIKNGEIDYFKNLYEKYKSYIYKLSKKFFLIGGCKEDIHQEGMIGLYKAISCYNADKSNSFKTFAELCITRQIITAVKSSTRKKHTPLNSYISLNAPVSRDEEVTFMEILSSRENMTPEKITIMKYIKEDLYKELSFFEKRVISLYVIGNSYKEISEKMGKDLKSIDNALQRIKKKLERNIKN